MHELSLCEGIVRIIEDQAVAQNFSRVDVVRVEIGRLSNVDPAALRFAFPSAARGGIAADARLEILDAPGAAWCLDCESTAEMSERGEPCPHCGSYRRLATAGEEMRVVDLDVR